MKGVIIQVTSAWTLLLLLNVAHNHCLAFQIRTQFVPNHLSKHLSAFTRRHLVQQIYGRIPCKRNRNFILSHASTFHETNATVFRSTNDYVPKRDDYYAWLEQATSDVFDRSRIPLGLLTTDDVEHITVLMSNWAKRKSTKGALTVEMLLKRIVDDHNAGNMSVNVNTRMYTIAIDAWAKVGGQSAAERADMIHAGMVRIVSTLCFLQPFLSSR